MDETFTKAHLERISRRTQETDAELAEWNSGRDGGWPVEQLLKRYVEGMLSRLLTLGQDTVFLIEVDRPLAVAMCARGTIETAGILQDFSTRLRKALDRRMPQEVSTIIKNYSFASKEFGDEYDVTTPHVMNGVRALELKLPGAMRSYEILCETVHPNWAGRQVSSKLDGNDAMAIDRVFIAAFFTADVLAELLKDVASLRRSFATNLRMLRRVSLDMN